MGGLEIEDIGDADDAAVSGLDSIIVGAPTWHTGEDEQRSGTEWDTWLYDTLPNLDLNGKIVGSTSTDGYDHESSKAERDGKFVGLMCDEDNQYDMSEDRAKAWVA